MIMTTETVNKLFSFGGKLFAGVALFAAGWVVINIACKTMREALRRSKLDVTLHSFIIMSSKVTMVLLLITSCIDVLGIGTNSIVAVIGAAGPGDFTCHEGSTFQRRGRHFASSDKTLCRRTIYRGRKSFGHCERNRVSLYLAEHNR